MIDSYKFEAIHNSSKQRRISKQMIVLIQFAEMCILFLGSENVVESTKFKQPGAIHMARWMAKLLYGIKICLLQAQISQLLPGIITTGHQVPKVRDFVIFATLI